MPEQESTIGASQEIWEELKSQLASSDESKFQPVENKAFLSCVGRDTLAKAKEYLESRGIVRSTLPHWRYPLTITETTDYWHSPIKGK